METTHDWLVNILALQIICIIGIGYRICLLAKRQLVLGKVKAPVQSLLRER